MRFTAKHIGLLAGLLFGWAVVQYGAFKAVFILAVGVAGWYVGRVLDGELELPVLRPGGEREELE